MCHGRGFVEQVSLCALAARRAAAEAEARASASADEVARVHSAAESELAAQRTAAKEALAEGTATARAHAEEQLQAALGQVGEYVTAGTGLFFCAQRQPAACACTLNRYAGQSVDSRSLLRVHRRSLRDDACMMSIFNIIS